MSDINSNNDSDNVLITNITPEFFKKEPYLAMRFKIVLREMLDYSKKCQNIISSLENSYSSLSEKHLNKLPFNYKDKIEKVKNGIKLNQEFYNKVVSLYGNKFDHITFTKEQHDEYQYLEEYLIRTFVMIKSILILKIKSFPKIIINIKYWSLELDVVEWDLNWPKEDLMLKLMIFVLYIFYVMIIYLIILIKMNSNIVHRFILFLIAIVNQQC